MEEHGKAKERYYNAHRMLKVHSKMLTDPSNTCQMANNH